MADASCDGFTAALYAKTSVPGGGGAAALCGALAVSLGAMAGNFTTGKKKFAAFEPDLQRMLAAAEQLRVRFLDLMDADAAAFEPLSKAYGIPKEDPDRAVRLREATMDAIQPPLQMMECCSETILLLEEMAEKCSRLMISDVGCGARMAQAALEAAFFNVLVNTRSLGEDPEAASIEAKAEEMRREYSERAAEVSQKVERRLKNE